MTHTSSESSRYSLNEQPWWTEADRADWDLVFKEFFDSAWLHKDWCWECAGIYKRTTRGVRCWCPDLQKDFARLMEWRSARILVSKAEYLRAQQLRRRTHERTV